MAGPNKKKVAKRKRKKTKNNGSKQAIRKQIRDAFLRKKFQIIRAIEEGMLQAYEEKPGRNFDQCITLGIQHARNLIAKNNMGLPNINTKHLNAALADLKIKGKNSPIPVFRRSFEMKKLSLLTEDEKWERRFTRAKIGPDKVQVRKIVRALYPRVVKMLERGSPYIGDVLGIINEECQNAQLNYIQAQKVAGVFVTYNPDIRKYEFTDEYYFIATKTKRKPRPLVKGKRESRLPPLQ